MSAFVILELASNSQRSPASASPVLGLKVFLPCINWVLGVFFETGFFVLFCFEREGFI